jgi:hypothetical protein
LIDFLLQPLQLDSFTDQLLPVVPGFQDASDISPPGSLDSAFLPVLSLRPLSLVVPSLEMLTDLRLQLTLKPLLVEVVVGIASRSQEVTNIAQLWPSPAQCCQRLLQFGLTGKEHVPKGRLGVSQHLLQPILDRSGIGHRRFGIGLQTAAMTDSPAFTESPLATGMFERHADRRMITRRGWKPAADRIA